MESAGMSNLPAGDRLLVKQQGSYLLISIIHKR
ncbi:hypothetical protein CL3_34760 [butyrate-producing bacterium SM4/1]|nr:hypothetical protein CL3_34760 [butyrate-producing bacterium SM4/1]